MDAYAGYYLDEGKLRESSSGGAASAISEEVIKDGGIVYGAAYSADFHSAVYGCAERAEELQKFKGSKYVYVRKRFLKNGREVLVYEDALSELKRGRLVLFVGLGCDITVLKLLAEKKGVDAKRLFTLELLCDGVTDEAVHENYVVGIEKAYGSKVTAFSVRYKKEGWVPLYIHAQMENGNEHVRPFYGSDYGFAFLNYKRKHCYNCQVKNQKHKGDLILGDFWGCRPGMEEYNPDGVSLIFVRTKKGTMLLERLKKENFFMRKIDVQYALHYSPRYSTSHERYKKWDVFDSVIRKAGLREAVRTCGDIAMPERFKNRRIEEIVLWGAGKCFFQYIGAIEEVCSVDCVVDSDETKWEKELGNGLACKSPDILRGKRNVLVLIMIENISAAFQVANRLLDMEITDFDYVHNWLYYADSRQQPCLLRRRQKDAYH